MDYSIDLRVSIAGFERMQRAAGKDRSRNGSEKSRYGASSSM